MSKLKGHMGVTDLSDEVMLNPKDVDLDTYDLSAHSTGLKPEDGLDTRENTDKRLIRLQKRNAMLAQQKIGEITAKLATEINAQLSELDDTW